MLGFSDVPFTLPPNAPSYHGCIEAKHITRYLEDYIDSHIYNGTSLRGRIRFGHHVENIEKRSKSWIVSARDSQGTLRDFSGSKLAVATGLTSLPYIPTILQRLGDFKGPIYHHKQFGEVSRTLLPNPKCQNVVVFGAGKSATDMVYESVKKGKKVSWIIRKDGEGPALYLSAPGGGGRYENSTEAGATRWKAYFSPSSFMPRGWLASLIHGTSYGINYLRNQISQSDQGGRDAAAYQDRQGASPTFLKLETTTSAFWYTGPLGLVQHDDFWDTLAQNVQVYRNNISSLKDRAIVLDDGTEIEADILLCGTGWNLQYPFFSGSQTRSLGLPHHPKDDSPDEAELWNTLLIEAEQRVLADFPILKDPPPHKASKISTTTLRMYNCIAPLDDLSIVFLGRAHVSNAFRTAEAQAIWATAYFDGHVKIPAPEQARRQIAYMNALSRKRYPSHGMAGDYLFFELIWYTDRLLEEVGLRSHRKGWWTDWVDPCLASDFEDVKREYLDKYYPSRD
ncbi:MAG: hypothetical protein Q9216_004624 [Gyalolechia sp. 2 TL-2023]